MREWIFRCGLFNDRLRRERPVTKTTSFCWGCHLLSSATGSKVEAATDLSWLFFRSGIHVAFSVVCFSTLLVLAHRINVSLQTKTEIQAQASSISSEGEASRKTLPGLLAHLTQRTCPGDRVLCKCIHLSTGILCHESPIAVQTRPEIPPFCVPSTRRGTKHYRTLDDLNKYHAPLQRP